MNIQPVNGKRAYIIDCTTTKHEEEQLEKERWGGEEGA